MNLLFICSKNHWRSPTAEKIFGKLPIVKTRSCGTANSARKVISSADIEWADLIFVMEQSHKQRIKSLFSDALRSNKLFVLDIPDDYKFMDPELIEILEKTVTPILEKECHG